MKTLVLAAGKSSRIAPLRNKNFLEFFGKPVLLHILENAKAGGLKNFVIVTNQEQLQKTQEMLNTFGFVAEIRLQKDLDEGMAGAVIAGLESEKPDQELFILNGTDFLPVEFFEKFRQKSETEELDALCFTRKVQSYFPGGYVVLDENQNIKDVHEKPGEGQEPSDAIKGVADYFRNAEEFLTILQSIPNLKNTNGYEDALQQIFREKTCKPFEWNGTWQPIKYPWHILDMKDAQFMHQKNEYDIKNLEKKYPNVHFSGNIIIEDGVQILGGSSIVGDVFLGKNSFVGQNCLVRDSIIGENCQIGFSSEVSRSFLDQSVSCHHSFIGDSVVMRNTNFGIFSATTNLRLDTKTVRVAIKNEPIDSGKQKLGSFVGENAQIGAGAKLMPGSKVPKNEIVFPNTIFPSKK